MPARTLGEALLRVAEACPGIPGLVGPGGGPGEHWRVSRNGDRFVEDPATALADGDCLLVLSAQAGG